MSKLAVYDMKGGSAGEVDIADDLLINGKGDQAVHEAVVAYLASQRDLTVSVALAVSIPVSLVVGVLLGFLLHSWLL